MLGDETWTLCLQAGEGDTQARERLLARLRPRLVLWATTRLSDAVRARVDPEDAAQEILLAIARDLGTFRGDSVARFGAWVYTLAEHRLTDLARRENALKRRDVERPVRTTTSPSEGAMRGEAFTRVQAALPCLEPEQREILRLRSIEERGYDEIAALLGKTAGACRIQHFRAVRALRDALADPGKRPAAAFAPLDGEEERDHGP